MSRIGRMPISLPSNVEVTLGEGNLVYGVIVKTKTGNYGMLQLENIWQGGSKLAWSAGFKTTEVHGNSLRSTPYAATSGDTIVEISYLTSKGEYSVHLADGLYLPKKHNGTVTAESVAVAAGSIPVTLADLPEDFSAAVSADTLTGAAYADGKMTFDAKSVLPGSYTITVSDESGVYAPFSTSVILTTDAMPAAYDAEKGATRFIHEGYQAVKAIPYDMPIVGYGNHVVDSLMIWDAQPKEEFSLDSFDRGDYDQAVEQENLARNLVEVLYPNDNHVKGKELRLKQQYFFVSASIQRALERFKKHHNDLHDLPKKVTFQMNDTHPTVAVAELMRILLDEEGMSWDEAWEITTHCVAYTNHTIMAEALEKWPIDIFQRLLPRVYQIVDEINRRFVEEIRAKYPDNEEKVRKMAILYDGQVKMANLAIVAGYSVNGVARLHTEILEKQELRDFYELFPEKFNNKTNGITQRRFLAHGNPLLADWVTKHVGKDWITSLAKVEDLTKYATDPKAQQEFLEIKKQNKIRLAKYIKEHNGIEVDPDSIFDVQVKRLHEYKRQLMNILHVMYLYNQIKANPGMDFYPRTFIFGAKAAAGYRTAKKTIKLINTVADVINNDPSINGKIKVVFIEDYRVSIAEWIFAAADVSEQISTASKEASGTGNMKFMLNGAITLGTMDGANVEMYEEVGADNIFIFGMSADEVIAHEQHHDYNPYDIYNNDEDIRKVVNQLVDGTYSHNDRELFRELYNSLLNPQQGQVADRYFILADFRAYANAQKKIGAYYTNKSAWAKSAILNIAHSGKFSSDRTIQEYVNDIWKLDKIEVNTEGC
mgnify:CR=1 FL=1